MKLSLENIRAEIKERRKNYLYKRFRKQLIHFSCLGTEFLLGLNKSQRDALIPSLVENLDDEVNIRALGTLNATEQLPVLLQKMRNPESKFRFITAHVVWRLTESPEALQLQLDMVLDQGRPSASRCRYIQSLGLLGKVIARSRLEQLLLDKDPEVRFVAAQVYTGLSRQRSDMDVLRRLEEADDPEELKALYELLVSRC